MGVRPSVRGTPQIEVGATCWGVMRLRAIGIVCALIVVALSATMSSATVFSGTLYTSYQNADGAYMQGLAGPEGGLWPSAEMSLSWVISNELTPPGAENYVWQYTYTFHVTGFENDLRDVSHFILETSPNIVKDDEIWDLTVDGVTADDAWEWDAWDTEGASNPDIPTTLVGIKFWGSKATDAQKAQGWYDAVYSFMCTREPVWGDFYAKDGNITPTVAVWNTGFTAYDYNSVDGEPDPGGDPSPYSNGRQADDPKNAPYAPYFYNSSYNPSGTANWAHILVPDSGSGGGPPVPELPPTLLAVMLPAVGLLLRRMKGR